MVTKELHDRTVQETTNIGGIGEDNGGIPIAAGLTFVMIVVVLFAISYLFINAPSAGELRNTPNGVNDIQAQPPGATSIPSRGPTLDENPMSRSSTVHTPSPTK